jgi:antitoxin (DNA-binding transcriptional repressor) of toxin-antitoxin stability system
LAQNGPVLITEHGQPVIAVIALDEAEAEAWLMGQSEELMEIVEQSRRRLRDEGGLSLEEMRQELGLPND